MWMWTCEHIHIREYFTHNCRIQFSEQLTVSTAIEHRSSFTFENLKIIPIQGKYNPEYGWTGACISNMGHRDGEHSHSMEDDGAMATAELS